jgi:hypothetical protein
MELIDLRPALERQGCSSVSDLLIEQPTLDFYAIADLLSDSEVRFAPADIEFALRRECEQRNDSHFYARATLFTALVGNNSCGWTDKHYLLAGRWAGMLGPSLENQANVVWDCLETLNLPLGWKPASIFDAVLEDALRHAFSK